MFALEVVVVVVVEGVVEMAGVGVDEGEGDTGINGADVDANAEAE